MAAVKRQEGVYDVSSPFAKGNENQLSKDVVLVGYLYTIYFGRGGYGVQSASKA